MSLLALNLALFAVAPGLPIEYRVTPAHDLASVRVEIKVPCRGETVDLRSPSWSPGYYVLENYGAGYGEVTAKGDDGAPRKVSHPWPDLWHVDTLGAGEVTVSYARPIVHESGRMGIFSADADTVHYGGPSIYLYVDNHKQDPCRIQFVLERPWGLAVALDPAGSDTFTAPNYDVLADSPVTIGKFRTASYEARGKSHLVAVRGTARDRLDLARALKMVQFITNSETDFFGGSAPYSRYVWHIWAGDTRDGAGGLEHASSSQDYLSIVEGPASMRGLAHEYFHLWNVKRVRASVLGPFDYTRLPRTGAFWWLEGVTDYYASLIPHRYGWYGDDEYLKDIAGQIRAVRSNNHRFEVSPYESSMRVGEAADRRGNSNGYEVSYYPTGWLLGMLFDIELRYRSGGAHSLDDVEHALWKLCKGGRPGFEEGEIRRQLVRIGGEGFGALYDQWVMKPGDLPFEAQLAKVGLELRDGRVVVNPSAGAAAVRLREGWFWGRQGRPARDNGR